MDMLLVILFCEDNGLLAWRVYAQIYPNRNFLDKSQFEKLLFLFRRADSVVYEKPIRQKPVIWSEENEFELISSFIENPMYLTVIVI